MVKIKTFEKQCRYCGDELTTQNTSKNFINDENYICFVCASGRTKFSAHRMHILEQVYDPKKNKIHGSIDKKANQHTDMDNCLIKDGLIKPSEKKYPEPKGRSFLVHGKEKECPKCHTILTTTNSYPENVSRRIYICKTCVKIDVEERENDPLYNEKMEIKSILLKLYARRRLKQFTWEYVKIRFAQSTNMQTHIIDEEEYTKTVKLFGEDYATKRFRPRHSFSLQASFGDLTTKEGCKKLLSLFEYELYKSRNAGARKKKKHEAKQYLKLFDPAYRTSGDVNKTNEPNDYTTHDKFCEEAYHGGKFISEEIHDEKWDPYKMEAI